LEDKLGYSALIAMSGGVDSAVAALLTQQSGARCAGATMVLFGDDFKEQSLNSLGLQDFDMPFYTFDFREHFSKNVIDPFIDEYYNARTPNPCVVCNNRLKFGAFLDKSLEMGMDYVITGHYAQVECTANGRFLLKKGVDKNKDQSYVLYTLTQEQLAHIKFPLGVLTKSEVRKIAQEAGLPNAEGKESQDICFIPDGDYAGFIIRQTGIVPSKGRFVDTDGNDLGENKGLLHYTVGQRRGLGLSMAHPPYVTRLCAESNTVVVGKNEQLFSKSFEAKNINFIPFINLEAPIKAQVKIRYKDPGHPATVTQTDEDTIHIEFNEPQRAITRGQSAVIYDGDVVVGGGIIC